MPLRRKPIPITGLLLTVGAIAFLVAGVTCLDAYDTRDPAPGLIRSSIWVVVASIFLVGGLILRRLNDLAEKPPRDE